MKLTSTVIALLVILTSTLSAQITIDQSDMPSQGDTFRYSITDSLAVFDKNQDGPNQTWDYGHMDFRFQQTDTFLSVSETGIAFQFAFSSSSNLAATSSTNLPGMVPDSVPSNSGFEFYNKTSSSFSKTGRGMKMDGTPIPIANDPADRLYRFPLTYGDTDTSESASSFSFPGVGGIYSQLTRYNEVDAYGTLITPYDTFTTLRVRSRIEKQDSIIYEGDTITAPRTEIHYKWLAKGAGQPVLQVNTLEVVGGTEIVATVKYQDRYRDTSGIDTSTGLSHKSEPLVSVYPTFVSGDEAINVEIKDRDYPALSITLFDLSGQLVWERHYSGAQHNNAYRIKPALESGMYILQVRNGNRKATRKVVVTP